jgi:hypothetical protein
MRARQARNAAALTLLARGAVLWLWGEQSPAHAARQQQRVVPGRAGVVARLEPDARGRGVPAFRARTARAAADHDVLRGGTWFRSSGPAACCGTTTRSPPRLGRGPLVLQMQRFATEGTDFLLQINGEPDVRTFTLPEAPLGTRWHVVVDTAAESPDDVVPLDRARMVGDPLMDRWHDPTAGTQSATARGALTRRALRPDARAGAGRAPSSPD